MLNNTKRDNINYILFAYYPKWDYLCNTINHTYKNRN
nr:MAG TPA: hypothetical protein [Caudoviricetes sp.]